MKLRRADLSETQPVVADDGIYHDLRELYFEANQRGLLDPESGVRSYHELLEKIKDKQVLYLWRAWMTGEYNQPEEYGGGMQ